MKLKPRSSGINETFAMETPMEAAAEEPAATAPASLFPVALRPASDGDAITNTHPRQWLCNQTFTTDLSVIEDAVKHTNLVVKSQSEEEEEGGIKIEDKYTRLQSHALVESSSDGERGRKKNKKKEKEKEKDKKRKISYSSSSSRSAYNFDATSRKPNVSSWDSSSSDAAKSTAKKYYFDSRGDRDNLAFGCIYRMDVARYKLCKSMKSYEINYEWSRKNLFFEGDSDIDALNNRLKSGGRYWSAKYSAVERHKNLKRIRIIVPIQSSVTTPGDFIPLLDDQTSGKGVDGGLPSGASVVEESWEDEVLRRTMEFNKQTREHPHDEKVWLAFSDFQDKVASKQPQKGARLQTLEKKISILEKATELNPDNEELLLGLLNAYQSRDGTDVFIGRWEKVLMQHPGSYKLWKEFLRAVQGDFSRFKVSEMRKMFANAIRALSSACSRQHRQAHQTANALDLDAAIVQQEFGLVDIFLSLCRFEWQAGYQELATALFQAEIEYSLFCPPLLLTEQSKHRLFEHFWNSSGARVGEDGAPGWATWLEKEEEERKKIISEESSNENEEGGWTGWSQPLSETKDSSANPESIMDDVALEELDEEFETIAVEQKDDTEALLKMLGIDADTDPNSEVKDTITWTRWSEEELSRDSDQWMPIRAKSNGISHGNATPDREGNEQLLSVILFEDVSEYLFSISSKEARLFLVFQFIDFYGGRVSKWTCTNSSTWVENTLSFVKLPDSILENLRRVHGVITTTESSPSNFSFEFLLGSSNDISMRTDMMTFLRNATLLCLTAFPHDYILEEAVLVAEELLNTKMDSCSCSVTPCRALAKSLVKSNRQDVLLCGVYARREAAYGNVDHARKIFDMALASIEGLPSDLRSTASLLYFWYAEVEISNSSSSGSEPSLRAVHILCCFGSGVKYSPFKCQASSVQQLRARQGFKERIRILRAAWAHGVIDDHSIALICSAALFEELTDGCIAGIEILNQAFTVVLPERRSQSYRLEFVFECYVRMLWRHHAELKLSKVWESVVQGLQIYPSNPELFGALVEISHLHTTPNKLRLIFDNYCQKNPSVITWLFALTFEMSRGGSQHRIRGLFERALGNEKLRNSVILWRCYITYEINVAGNPSAARRIFFRAIHACPRSKKLWLDGFLKLHTVLTAKELSDLQEVMRDKELNLRTDIYEILLQDDIQL
ncbi:LOW QUALITY PROTEIN: uncharacterized protein LOC130750153 [Actinidia eriantha]|uniref:LOW QUALITY PROTEIN: uncharacterized protein LOC130750153 n=1 Tax=Actinidia eriantha TaxID=165200 RepID=UPI00258AF65A|nr:LOW QUALITY PROTEIN: uncharacterized protein LOC130750153 [Actinidia eriantha]